MSRWVNRAISAYSTDVGSSPVSVPESGHAGRSVPCQKETHALQQMASLFNNRVGGEEQFVRNRQAKNLCGLEIDDQLEFGGLLNW